METSQKTALHHRVGHTVVPTGTNEDAVVFGILRQPVTGAGWTRLIVELHIIMLQAVYACMMMLA